MRILPLFVVLLFGLPASCTSYYMSPTGRDEARGSTPATAWASPRHSLNCGDSITAAAGNYKVNAFDFGNVTCAGGNNVAWLRCARAFACTGTVSSGGQYAAGINIGRSYWGVQGWVISVYAGGGACFSVIPATPSLSIHHIVLANNIMNGCGQGGVNFSPNGSAGVDYGVVIGNIVYNATQGSNLCTSGVNVFSPVATDNLSGTHYYLAGNFVWGNVEPNPCNGGAPTDGQGLFFDTMANYAQQMVIDNNISIFNGGAGIKGYSNWTAKQYIRSNTTYGNNTAGVNGAVCGEIELQSNKRTAVYLNLSQTTSTKACFGGMRNYVLAVQGGDSTDTLYTGFGNSQAGNYIREGGAKFIGNTFSNPSFRNPVEPPPPSCSSFQTTTACMATVISNFTPTAAAAQRFGYQRPQTTSTTDPLYPKWLCGVALPSGLVTPGCSA